MNGCGHTTEIYDRYDDLLSHVIHVNTLCPDCQERLTKTVKELDEIVNSNPQYQAFHLLQKLCIQSDPKLYPKILILFCTNFRQFMKSALCVNCNGRCITSEIMCVCQWETDKENPELL